MKQFSKIIFASMIGTFFALGLLFFTTISAMVALSGSGSGSDWKVEQTELKDNSVLGIVFDGPVVDRAKKKDIFAQIFMQNEPSEIGLYNLKRSLRKAAKDDNIKGLFLRFVNYQSGMANSQELRRLIEEFKQSGKFVIAYSEMYSESSYIIASAADEVVLYPKGFFEWDGIFSKLAFFKNTIKKLDFQAQVFRVGKYKSAIEPYINDKMSESSREQIDAIIDTAWDQLVKYASEKTKLSADELNSLANDMSVIYAKDAFEKGFVNLLASREEVDQKLMELTGAEEKPHFISWRAYHSEHVKPEKHGSKNKVAVVYAAGGIGSGRDEGDNISSRGLVSTLTKLRRDKDVKAVVLRVNSPGGSALASDVIWTSTQWLKDSKPFVTSFGNVAASGGYYISAGSQHIYAEPLTITGSIGVFGLSFATKKFWNDKIGMTFDTAKSHRFSDMESLVRPFDADESAKMQGFVETVYEDFLGVVTKGRPKLSERDAAHEVAQGRVWIGADALERGLVDELGGVDQAIAKAAELAQITDYDVVAYPRQKSPFEDFLSSISDVSTAAIQSLMPDRLLKLIEASEKQKPLQERVYTRMPFDIEIH